MAGMAEKSLQDQKSLQEQRDQRLRNLDSLRERGFDDYPYDFKRSHLASELQVMYPNAQAGEHFDTITTIAGRAMTVRGMGKVTFVTLQDSSGTIQAYFQKDALETTTPSKKLIWEIGSK